MRALYYLRRSNECDPQDHPTVHGLAFAYMELGDMKLAQKHFPAVLEIGGTRGAAQSGQEWAARDCRPRTQGQGATHGCGLLSARCHAAVSREVAAGDSGDHFRDRYAGQVRAGYQ